MALSRSLSREFISQLSTELTRKSSPHSKTICLKFLEQKVDEIETEKPEFHSLRNLPWLRKKLAEIESGGGDSMSRSLWIPEKMKLDITEIEAELVLLKQNQEYLKNDGSGDTQMDKPITWQLKENETRFSTSLEETLVRRFQDAGSAHISSPYKIRQVQFGDVKISAKDACWSPSSWSADRNKILKNREFLDELSGSGSFPIDVQFSFEDSNAIENVTINGDGSYSYEGKNKKVHGIVCVLAEAVKRK